MGSRPRLSSVWEGDEEDALREDDGCLGFWLWTRLVGGVDLEVRYPWGCSYWMATGIFHHFSH